MALLTLHRPPSISTAPDESIPRRGRLQKRESFALVKGAVLLLEGEREEPHEETSPNHSPSPLKLGGGASDTQHRHLHAMVSLLRPEDTIKLAVRLESVSPVRVRYLIVVSTLSNKQESILLGMDFPNTDSDQCTIGMVVPIWSATQVYLDGDGGFSVTSAEETRIFKPVSIQTMWSVLQALHGCCERAVKGAVIPGCGLDWAQHYYGHVESNRLCLNEWGAMTGLESIRRDSAGQSSSERVSVERQIKEELRDIMRTEDLENITSKQVRSALETRIGMDMKNYKEYIDNEMMVTMAQMDKPSKIFDYLFLGSEWNAANFEELQKNNVGYILNITREIDNFFPESFSYMNIRVYDVEATDLLSHWKDTYTFINTARQSGKAVLVHCKMGVSRSGSTVVAYAMKQQRWPLEVALSYVRDRRPIVQPNVGFMKQLHTYSGILNASQQRHSALWRRMSREKRKRSAASRSNEEEEEEEEEEESDDEEEDEEEMESPDEVDEADKEVFEDPAPKVETGAEASLTEPASQLTEPASQLTEPASPITEPASPLTEPASPLTEPASPLTEPASPLTEPASPLTEPAAPLTEPAAPPTEPAAPPTEPAAPPTEPAAPPTEPAAPPTEPAAPPTEPSAANPLITVHDSDKASSQSPSRSGRMNLFSLMQSINELDDEDLRNEQIANSHRRSPGQRRRSHGRKGLMHQRAHVDVSPEPSSLSGPRKCEGAGPSKPESREGDTKMMEGR
ncbi:protein phosphatase Slingshot homolog 3 [Salmo salar]|uniref:protein-serine/threonine phosphatase n=1 Tax=Salmo salar TaxID=8030 RepID=A0A1S3STJ0_SALSA|nr:protein phosphatase Slingshot homolog 3-like [Salmo salar]XP_014067656.2 protein phosphatase Slingshot homolog 3-like [Salmo salar]XP_014067658.2 protein phosphatase Slingshot homolog 3-like [Salmo salar]XP_014067659.2 protein phosphatase Slingshot homolog 3-like [Salmo salar]XP_014067660.2 protein phosphatase Slingshot homolog 3-like [Salmo salar]XP_014067661.2 protein phosphatase Slingshot homolog 3-like [Salmo salar]XP_014067662.2 protein phosphatase Slingshot homolog 3-like [Salmo sala